VECYVHDGDGIRRGEIMHVLNIHSVFFFLVWHLTGNVELVLGGSVRVYHLRFGLLLICTNKERSILLVTWN